MDIGNIDKWEKLNFGKLNKDSITPDEALMIFSKFFQDKNREYGNAWLNQGNILKALFPNGIELNTAEEFMRFHLILQMVIKLERLCFNFDDLDSSADLSIFAAMAHSVIPKRRDHND